MTTYIRDELARLWDEYHRRDIREELARLWDEYQAHLSSRRLDEAKRTLFERDVLYMRLQSMFAYEDA
jgi:hypothetical protein